MRLIVTVVAAVLALAGCAPAPGRVSLRPSSPTASEAMPTGATTPGTPRAPSPTPSATRVLAGKVIVVDPGHNGGNFNHPRQIAQKVDAGGFQKACNTTGTAAQGVTESSLNWAIAQKLAQRFRAAGAKVVLTRTDDQGVGPCIDKRGKTAKNNNADLLISIHSDGAHSSGHGFHVILPKPVRGYTDATAGPSARLGACIRDSLVTQGLTTSTYVGRDGLHPRSDMGTLNNAGAPAVMMELGNMHNTKDFALLTSPNGQTKIVDGLVKGAEAFLR